MPLQSRLRSQMSSESTFHGVCGGNLAEYLMFVWAEISHDERCFLDAGESSILLDLEKLGIVIFHEARPAMFRLNSFRLSDPF